MDTNEQVETQITYPCQPTHENGKPMNTPLPLSSEVYQYGMSVMTKNHYTMCTARSKDEAMKIVQALNRAPVFDAMVAALEEIAQDGKGLGDAQLEDTPDKICEYCESWPTIHEAAYWKSRYEIKRNAARAALKIAKGEA
jgi:hypothetical protein